MFGLEDKPGAASCPDVGGGSDLWVTNKRHIGLYFGVAFCFQRNQIEKLSAVAIRLL